MTENFSDNRSQRSSFSKPVEPKQTIVSMEYVLDTEMLDIFTVEVLRDFGTIIIAAIDAMRDSNEEIDSEEEPMLRNLRQARIYIQLAIDEFSSSRNNKKRYEYIELTRKELKAALTKW